VKRNWTDYLAAGVTSTAPKARALTLSSGREHMPPRRATRIGEATYCSSSSLPWCRYVPGPGESGWSCAGRGPAPRPRDRGAGHCRRRRVSVGAPAVGRLQRQRAWAALRAIAHNLTCAAGTLASTFHAKAATATIRAHLINVPARIPRRAWRLALHLPQGWPWQAAWTGLHPAVHRPTPAPA
jgi:hypothetical protein